MGRGYQHRSGPRIRPNIPENCMKMKKIGLIGRSGEGAHPKFYYVDPPLDNEKPWRTESHWLKLEKKPVGLGGGTGGSQNSVY